MTATPAAQTRNALGPGAAGTGLPEGLRLLPGFLDRAAQEALRDAVFAVMDEAPPFRPTMPKTGKPFSVTMTNCGRLGWRSDAKGGYRYAAVHPVTGKPWPPMPRAVLEIWRALAEYPAPPEACLVNIYSAEARMGLHRDTDEADFAAPILSLSFGDTALFRIGGPRRAAPTRSFKLHSGDVLVLGGAARLCFHGIDRVFAGSSTLLPDDASRGRRINLTLRRVTCAAA